jgi:hypothetical protein
MYPSRDFRSLLQRRNEVPTEQIIRSISREPFPEILRYWEKTNKPEELYPIYSAGLEDAVAKDRYPLFQLKEVTRFPEFTNSVIRGLRRLWLKCTCSINNDDEGLSLIIDSNQPNTISISPEDRLKILNMNLNQSRVDFFINGAQYKVRLILSKRAQEIHQFLAEISPKV